MTPYTCMYYVTLRCNSKCVYCDIWSDPECRSSGDADPKEVKENLAGLKRLGVRYIDFTGGEPLMCEPLPEILGMAKEMGFKTGLVSNGLLYSRRAHDLRGKVDSLSFSLDGPSAEIHNEQRGIKGFGKVIESLQLAKSLGEPVDINCTVTNDNYQLVPDMVKLAQELKVPVYLNPAFSYFGNDQLNSEVAKQLERYFKEPFVIVNLAGVRFAARGGNDIRKPRCRAIGSVVVVNWDNHLLLPCYHQHFKRVPINGDIYAAYRSEEVQEMAKKVGTWDFCQNCTIWCYMGPSFLHKVDGYFFLYAYSMLKAGKEIYLNGHHKQPDPGAWERYLPKPDRPRGVPLDVPILR